MNIKFSILSLILTFSATLVSCNTKQVPGYEILDAVGVLDTSMVMGHAAIPTHFFGNPDETTLTKDGNGSMFWKYEKRFQSDYQKPVYVDTQTEYGPAYPTTLYGNTNTVPVTTTTTVSGGGMGTINHLSAYNLRIDVKNFQIISYNYSERGYAKIPILDKSSSFISTINAACRRGDIKTVKATILAKPGFILDADNLIRSAIEAAKYDQDELLEYLLNTYNIDVDKEVKSYMVVSGYYKTPSTYSMLRDHYVSPDDETLGYYATVSKVPATMSVRSAAMRYSSEDVLAILAQREMNKAEVKQKTTAQ